MPISIPNFQIEDDLWWSADTIFPSWAGFQRRRGAYGSLSSNEPSDGHVRIVIAPEGRGIEPLTDSEKAQIVWVIENEAKVSTSLLASVFEDYPKIRKQYGYPKVEMDELMPDIDHPDNLRRLIGLHSVNIHPLQKDGIPYLGYELGCTWDDEHGLGVLMHGTRVVQIGGADTAILLWIAKRDAEKS